MAKISGKIGLKNSTGSEVGIFGEALVKGELLCTCSWFETGAALRAPSCSLVVVCLGDSGAHGEQIRHQAHATV